jgi:hypothetical protein
MSIENPSRDKQRLVALLRESGSAVQPRKSLQPEHEFFDVLSLPLREDATMSDDERRQRSVDNMLALLKANAQLRALAVRLSEILAARGGWSDQKP